MNKRAMANVTWALVAAAVPLSSLHAGVLVGGPGDPGVGNCAPFGCSDFSTYQQIYDSSLFSAPLSIAGVTFFLRNFDHAGFGITPTINPANYTIDFSIVPFAPGALNPMLATNINPDPAMTKAFFQGPLGDGSTLVDHFTVQQNLGDFVYDPSQGNLLMQVTTDAMQLAFTVYMDVPQNFAPFSVGFDANPHPDAGLCNVPGASGSFSGGDPAGCVQTGYGLVTEFKTPADFTVPEPGTGLLVAGSILAALGIRRRLHS